MPDEPPSKSPDDGSPIHRGYEDWNVPRRGGPWFIEPEPDEHPDVPGNEPLGPARGPSKDEGEQGQNEKAPATTVGGEPSAGARPST